MNLENSEIRIVAGKNEKDRVIAILPQLIPILREYQTARTRLGDPSIWFFPSVKSGKQLTIGNLHEIFRKISRLARMKVTPHMLRHTFGRLCIEANTNMRVVQTMMGHSSISTTQIYTHVSTEAMKESFKETQLL